MKCLCTQYLIKERTKPVPELWFFVMHRADQGGQLLCRSVVLASNPEAAKRCVKEKDTSAF